MVENILTFYFAGVILAIPFLFALYLARACMSFFSAASKTEWE